MSKPTIATRDDLLFVLPAEQAAVLELDRADVLVLRLDAGDADRGGVVGALHADAAGLELGADDGNHRRLGRERPRVVEREEDLPAGPFAAGLQARAAAPDDADVLAELAQDLLVALLEALAHRRQDDHRDHAPQDAEHRQDAAQLVGAQVLKGLNEALRASAWQQELVARLEAVEDLDLGAVADAELDGGFPAAVRRAGDRRHRRTPACAAS